MSHISDPHFAERVRASFDRQHAMHLIEATLPVVEHGRTEIHLPHWQGIEQQHGFVHGGVVGMIADSAAGYAAMTVRKVGRMWSSGVGEAMSSTAGSVVQVLLVLLGLSGELSDEEYNARFKRYFGIALR